jgi:hypothetical protein
MSVQKDSLSKDNRAKGAEESFGKPILFSLKVYGAALYKKF